MAESNSERTSVTRDDIRQFRAAISGALGLTDRDVLPQPDPAWRDTWSNVAELGIIGLCVPESLGGSGFEVEVAVATAMELGGALHGSPYPGTVAGARALSVDPATIDGGTHAAVIRPLLADLLAGEKLAAFGRIDAAGEVARAVDGADVADAVVVEIGDGSLVLLTDPTSWTPTGLPRDFDVSRTCSDLQVDLSKGHPLGSDPAVGVLFGLLVAADAVGGAQRALARTVDYAKDRVAFGKPIGGFQAVQHRLADHAVRLRGLELLVSEAARAIGDSDGDGDMSARRKTLLAEAGVSSTVPNLLHDLVQLTGGIGFTWEYGLHFYGRRAHQDALLGANPRRAQQLLAIEEGWL